MSCNYEIYSNNLTKKYKTKKIQNIAVDHINLRIRPGIHGFLGPNGAGKTTTINMLMGTISITEGEAFIRGYEAGSIEARRMIGFLPQDPILYSRMTTRDYLIFTAQLFGLKKKESMMKADELLRFFDLYEEREKFIAKCSGGMKQKVGLASALIHEPQLLILDEPTTNLDPLGRQNVIDFIKKLSSNVSIFLSSHILSEIEQVCNEVSIIVDGKIILSDKIQNIKKYHNKNQEQYILDTSANMMAYDHLKSQEEIKDVWVREDGKIQISSDKKSELQEIISKLVQEKKLIIHSFYQPEDSLQDIFLKLTKKD